jgi:hypothetical protein
MGFVLGAGVQTAWPVERFQPGEAVSKLGRLGVMQPQRRAVTSASAAMEASVRVCWSIANTGARLYWMGADSERDSFVSGNLVVVRGVRLQRFNAV